MRTVLVVEDDFEIRELVAELLQAEGYEVLQAENGRAALEVLQREPRPDLVLLDLMMPVMSGPELLEVLAEDEALARVPVVVVSAIADQGTAPGVKRFLRKPVPGDVLRQVVAEYCAA